MPNEKDRDLSPEEGSEEKKYSFTSLEIFKNLAMFSKEAADKIPLLSKDLIFTEMSGSSESGIFPLR